MSHEQPEDVKDTASLVAYVRSPFFCINSGCHNSALCSPQLPPAGFAEFQDVYTKVSFGDACPYRCWNVFHAKSDGTALNLYSGVDGG